MLSTVGVAQRKNRKSTHGPNEDRFRVLDQRVRPVREADRGHLFAVADGVGDAALGMRAAQHAVDGWLAFFTEGRPLAELARALNDEIYAWGQDETGKSLGAAAVSAAWVAPPADRDADLGRAVILHAGDTQVVRVSDGQWTVLTRSQSEGRSPLNYFGRGPAFQLSAAEHPLALEDALVLATDGVSVVVSPGEMVTVLTGREPQAAADELVRLAWARGSVDDLTAVVVRIDDRIG